MCPSCRALTVEVLWSRLATARSVFPSAPATLSWRCSSYWSQGMENSGTHYPGSALHDLSSLTISYIDGMDSIHPELWYEYHLNHSWYYITVSNDTIQYFSRHPFLWLLSLHHWICNCIEWYAWLYSVSSDPPVIFPCLFFWTFYWMDVPTSR